MKGRARLFAVAAALLVGVPLAAQTPEPLAGPPPIEVAPPALALNGVTSQLQIRPTSPLPDGSAFQILDTAGNLLGSGIVGGEETATVEIDFPAGDHPYRLEMAGIYRGDVPFRVRSVNGWLTLLPPLVAILLALIFRQVVPALLAGCWVGAWALNADPLSGALRAVDQYVVGALGDSGRVSILIFSLCLGGMVAVLSRSGGTIALVEALAPYATSSRRGQVVSWLMGLLVFFDDYANTLLVGNTMRPVTDRLRISREKLAYIVDSTAAPVASIALVSTWIGYEVSLIGSSLKEIGSDREPFVVFLESLPYNFYPILALVFGLLIASTHRDFGPMLRAERRARAGKVLADDAVPLADFDTKALDPPADKPRRWINAVLPIATVVLITFAGLWITGQASLAAGDYQRGGASLLRHMGSVFSAGDSLKSLLWASVSGSLLAIVLAVGQRILSLAEGIAAWVDGLRSMTMAYVILILAWAIADVCSDLNTRGYLVSTLSDSLDPRLLPALVFVLSGLTAFATGTSWGAMGILIPLAVPTAFGLAETAGIDPATAYGLLLGSVSAVLAGAIFGDHCSPISDTTVLSSMATGCDHVDHVRTQLPYAVTVAGVALLVCYLPAGFGLSPFICLALSAVILAGAVFWVGRPVSN